MEKVVCRICNGQYARIGNHLQKHSLTVSEYRQQFPDAPTCAYRHSEETKEKMRGERACMRGKPKSEETKRKLSEFRKGKTFKPHSPETLEKMREAWVRRKADKERFAEYIAALSQRMSTPEMQAVLRDRAARLIKERNHNGKSSDTSLERRFEAFLVAHQITFEQQYILQTKKGLFTFDFFIPDMNLLVETDGEYWHRKSLEQVNRDDLKERLATSAGIHLVRISDLEWCPDIIFASVESQRKHNRRILEARYEFVKAKV